MLREAACVLRQLLAFQIEPSLVMQMTVLTRRSSILARTGVCCFSGDRRYLQAAQASNFVCLSTLTYHDMIRYDVL